MLRWKHNLCLLVVAILMVAMLPHVVTSAGASCSVDVSPANVAPASNSTFHIVVTNTGSTDLQWVDITATSANLKYGGSYINDWAGSEHGDGITLTNNTLNQGANYDFQVAGTAELRSSLNNWRIQASDDSGGAGPVTCSGNTGTTISGHPPNDTNNGISNVFMAGSATTSSATITWDSDSAVSSIVYYGQTSDYGASSSYDPNLLTSHSVTLTGLSAGTSYHFQVAGSDGQGTFAYSSDGTFTTAAAPVSAGGSSGGSSGPSLTPTIPGAVLKPTPTERVPPTISLTTDLSHPFGQAPAITGVASDNEGVASLEYSTDGGVNWQAVTDITHPNKRNPRDLKFTFTPVFIDDGNYTVQARATDTSGNTALTPSATVIIDRLPPRTGPIVLAYGPQLLQPDPSGAVNLVAGNDYRVTTNAVGGPTSLVLSAQPVSSTQAKRSLAANFILTQTVGSGLWSGSINLKTGGAYQLIARGIDGAGNHSERVVMMLNVLTSGKVVESGSGKSLAGAQIIVHYREPASGAWQIWDGKAYRQTNPQTTSSSGTYSLVVPRGTYYLEAKKSLHYSFISDIFTTTQPQSVTAPIALGTIPHLNLGPVTLALPNFVWQSHELSQSTAVNHQLPGNRLLGTVLPDFTLPTTNGSTQTALGLSGKPTLITILSTWSPDSQAQIPQLAAAQSNPDINIAPIFSQEHAALVKAYLDSAGYSLTALVDADGALVEPLGIGPLPEHIFIDSTGKVKKIMVGVFTKDELLLQLGGL